MLLRIAGCGWPSLPKYVVRTALTIGLTVSDAERPIVFQALMSGSLFQPLTTLACKVSWSLTFKPARIPVWSSGMMLNSNEREYSQFLLASMTSAPAVVVNLPKSRVRLPGSADLAVRLLERKLFPVCAARTAAVDRVVDDRADRAVTQVQLERHGSSDAFMRQLGEREREAVRVRVERPSADRADGATCGNCSECVRRRR